MTTHPQTPPLIVLGLNVGDCEAIRQWVAEGHLPAIASVMQRGCWGSTGGPEMICEYGVGLTLFSGISRARHGHYYFRQLKPGTYDLQRVTPADVDAPPFWTHLRGTGRKVLIVDAPEVRLVPSLPGLQLGEWATHHLYSEAFAEPTELLDEVQRLFGPRVTVPVVSNLTIDEARHAYRLLRERVEKKGALCRHLLAGGPFDLTVITFADTDPASHLLWDYRHAANDLTGALRDIYQAIDRELGTLLARLPVNANVAIYSLYGMQDEYPTSTLIESFCRELGYHVMKAPRAQSSFRPVALARRLLPETWRAAISRHLPRGSQERLLADLLCNGTDWSRTTAFAIPSLYTSFVRVNLRGREPRGIVVPGAEYDAVLDRLEADLKVLVDERTGQPAVRRVARAADLFGGGPPRSLPDLFVKWQPGPHLLTRVVHPRAVLVQPRPSHCPSSQEKLAGFVAAAGPSITGRGDIGEVSILDLAPTFLSLLDVPVPSTLTERVLKSVVPARSG